MGVVVTTVEDVPESTSASAVQYTHAGTTLQSTQSDETRDRERTREREKAKDKMPNRQKCFMVLLLLSL